MKLKTFSNMKKIMGIIGLIVILPFILVETLIKVLWGVAFYAFYPFWKCMFSVWVFSKLESYTHFKHEYILVPKILRLWDIDEI